MNPLHANLHPTCPCDSNTAAASWSAVAEMRGRSLASATPLSSAPPFSHAFSALAKRCRASLASLANALHDAGAIHNPQGLLAGILASMTCLSSCDEKAEEAPKASKPAAEASQASWRDWIAKSADPTWWKVQGDKAADAATGIKATLDSINVEEVKQQAIEIVKAIESQDFSKVEAVAGELGKHLTIEKLVDGLRFVIIQRQKGGEAASKAIDEYAARPDLNEFEKIAAQNLKAGLSTVQRDDVRGVIAGAIAFACECKLGAHRGGFLAVPIISILFPEYYEKQDRKP